MTPAEQFFYDHAGYSHGPDESPEEGKRRCAILLADAERWAKRKGLAFTWEDDWEGDHSYREGGDWDPIETCEVCIVTSRKGKFRTSLSCIDDATPEYRRVVEAELAMEVMG